MGLLDWFKEDKQKNPEDENKETMNEGEKNPELERKRAAYKDPTADKETINLLEEKRKKEEEELKERRKNLEDISEDEHTNLDQKAG